MPPKFIIALFLCTVSFLSARAQSLTGQEVLSKFNQTLKALSSLQYTVHNVDTFIDGHASETRGEALLMRNYSSEELPFKLHGKNDANIESTFDGGRALTVYHATKEFEIEPYTDYREIIGTQVGRLILSEFLFPETPFDSETGLGYNKLSAQELLNEYLLTIYYPDNKLYGIQNRFKKITIDKQTGIPVSYYHKFDTPYGEKQVNIRKLDNIRLNEASISFPLIDTGSFADYQQLDRRRKAIAPTYQQLLNTNFIDMKLKNINGSTAQLSERKGKITLLAFWETWCSPCIESIPKVKQIISKYSPDTFEVWGIVSDEKTFSKVPSIVKRTGINYPVYYGTEQTKKDYRVTGVPEYVIIDKAGKIVFINAGFSEAIEKTLDELLK